jgi:hypothetical protein
LQMIPEILGRLAVNVVWIIRGRAGRTARQHTVWVQMIMGRYISQRRVQHTGLAGQPVFDDVQVIRVQQVGPIAARRVAQVLVARMHLDQTAAPAHQIMDAGVQFQMGLVVKGLGEPVRQMKDDFGSQRREPRLAALIRDLPRFASPVQIRHAGGREFSAKILMAHTQLTG